MNERKAPLAKGTYADRLVINGWDGKTDLSRRPGEVISVRNECTDLYGRFAGGLPKGWITS
ncbi:hypothetical protein [Nonomuraea sp. NPDC050783]|uniref:hypothetical protein n=1 Tax=Nonomuraea sp. NPDC050783 TaxID=3154634 RepID=UPI0034650ED6